MPKIVGVAILIEDRLYSAPAPNRHNHVIKLACEAGEKTPIGGEQGFVLEDGKFVDRVDGAAIHVANGNKLKWPPLLYSEDLW